MSKATKKFIEYKYKTTNEVNIEDVRTLVNMYENKIKRLKYLLNTYIQKSEAKYMRCLDNAFCMQMYINRFIHVYRQNAKAIDKETLDALEQYIEKHAVYSIKRA